MKKHLDAAFLAEYYVQDFELAGQCLVDGLFFSEAWSLRRRRNLNQWRGNIRYVFMLSFLIALI